MKMNERTCAPGSTRDELERLARKAAETTSRRARNNKTIPEGGASQAKKKPGGGEAAKRPSGPEPAAAYGPIAFTSHGGDLPDTSAELMEVINNPNNVAHALAAMAKLGELHGRDAIDDNSSPTPVDFNPMIVASGVGSNKQAIASFVCYAVPLRRALARHFQANTPDIAMMLDMVTVAYWKAVQAERISVTFLCAALEKPDYLDKLPKLEMVKELAVRQMTRLLEALRVATGRRLTIDPDEDIAKVLRFPQTANPLQRRARRASAG